MSIVSCGRRVASPARACSLVGTGKKAAHHSIDGVAFDEFGQTAIRLSDDEEDLLAEGG
jgi:hypothetical protein